MSRLSPLGTKRSELLNIQKRDWPCFGPSFTNSWPSPFPHFPQRTYMTTYFKFMFESKPMPHMNIHSDCNVCLQGNKCCIPWRRPTSPLAWRGYFREWFQWMLAMVTNARIWTYLGKAHGHTPHTHRCLMENTQGQCRATQKQSPDDKVFINP